MNRLIKSVFIVCCCMIVFSNPIFGQKNAQTTTSFDSATLELFVKGVFDGQDTYDPLIQQHFAFDADNKVFAVINMVENRIDIVHLSGTDSLNLEKSTQSILVDKYEGRHDLAMIFRPQGIAIYENHIVFLASNRDSCFLSVLDLDGNQVVKKGYRGNASAFSYSKERTELYIAGEYDLGYNIIVINTEKGIANADYDNAPVFNYKKPKKAEAIQSHDPFGIGLTIIAMGVVFLTLLMLSIIFITYGKTLVSLQNKRAKRHVEKKNESSNTTTIVKKVEDISGEEYAAITAAIYLYNDELHDQENTVLTIQHVSRRYSPWSAKGLNMNGYFRNRK
ncbi:MAG: OadG family protein [Bacteroidales bacterium]|nr:OadG family protein [Bacteroidales bacterium]